MSVFARFERYGFIHHRALNAPETLAGALEIVRANPARTHILEADICWDFENGAELFYFRHPSAVFDTLSRANIEQGIASGKLLTLDSLDALKDLPVLFVIELKVGRGDRVRALGKLVERLETAFSGRYWIDGFSLTLLRIIKDINPGTPVSLHSEAMARGHSLVLAPECPLVSLKRLSTLDFIDAFAIRRHFTTPYMARACADIRATGKPLIVSRLFTLEHFEQSLHWGACAGYNYAAFGQLTATLDRFRTGNAA